MILNLYQVAKHVEMKSHQSQQVVLYKKKKRSYTLNILEIKTSKDEKNFFLTNQVNHFVGKDVTS